MKKELIPAIHFWPYVDASAGPDACHLWTKRIDHGYGRIQLTSKGVTIVDQYAHRVAWELENEQTVPRGKFIIHNKGCPRNCVNPKHLRAGTHLDNLQDMRYHGSHRGRVLKPDQVIDIRQSYAGGGWTYAKLAQKYGVHDACIYRVINRLTWANIQ